jgi:hypothetical protein
VIVNNLRIFVAAAAGRRVRLPEVILYQRITVYFIVIRTFVLRSFASGPPLRRASCLSYRDPGGSLLPSLAPSDPARPGPRRRDPAPPSAPYLQTPYQRTSKKRRHTFFLVQRLRKRGYGKKSHSGNNSRQPVKIRDYTLYSQHGQLWITMTRM